MLSFLRSVTIEDGKLPFTMQRLLFWWLRRYEGKAYSSSSIPRASRCRPVASGSSKKSIGTWQLLMAPWIRFTNPPITQYLGMSFELH
jgi:hypothetical protein